MTDWKAERRTRSFAPTPEKLDDLEKVSVADLAEAVDVAFIEFMTSIHECAARAGINPKVTLSWLMAQMVDANYHWSKQLGQSGYVNFPRGNPFIGERFAETVKRLGKTK